MFTGVRRMLSIDAKMVSNTVKLFSFSLETKGFDGPMEHNYFISHVQKGTVDATDSIFLLKKTSVAIHFSPKMKTDSCHA